MSSVTLRPASGAISLRIRRRSIAVVGLLLAFVLALAAVAVTLGEYPIPLERIIGAFTGTESDAVRRIVVDGRLPRILLALVGGAALGLSGAIFQSLTRNPLGSPDIIGFSAGAYTGALLVIIVAAGNYVAISLGALAGGLAAAFLVYVLAFRRGIQGFRLIVIGIAISAVLQAVNSWLIISSRLETAIVAATWGAGSLNGSSWRELLPVLVTLVILLPALALVARPLKALELGDDAAQGLGVRVEPFRLALVVVGVALTAVVTAVTGPIAFVALAAPQLARRLTRSAGIALVPSAVLGAALLLASDVLAQRLLAPTQLPVGLVTVSLGGLYLVGLLISQAKAR